jgi:N-acetylglucosaminyl-diphospho-decaprenol L-rhamnosyltransferase
MRCSVVVVTRDRHEVLADTLPRHEAPVIVVDNASARPIPGAIRLDRNLGGAGRNVGVRAAQTEYVALTDDDAWWEPGALAAAVAWMDAHPHVALLQPRVLVGAHEQLDPVCAELERAPHMLGFVACAVMVRRSAFLSVGGFHERLATGGEEELLAWDLAAAGWELAYEPSVVAHHCPPGGNRPGRREVQLRNALWTPWLRRPWPVALRHTLAALRSAPREMASARGVLRALAGVLWVARERRPGPPHVEAMRRRLDRRSAPSFPTDP